MVKLYFPPSTATLFWASEWIVVFDIVQTYAGGSISTMYGTVYGPLL